MRLNNFPASQNQFLPPAFWRDGVILGTTTLAGVTAGSVAGLPWLPGAERDGATTADINEFFAGSLDDFGIWDRILTEGEIQALSSKSPVCGAHKAQMVIAAGGDSAERVVELRSEVNETTGVYVIDTVPTGQPIFVDGQEITSPATFAVRCASRNPSEWLEGSVHTIAPKNATFTVASGADTLTYIFTGWDRGGTDTATISATRGDKVIVGRYIRSDVKPPGGAQSAARAPRDIPPAIAARIGGTPQGPWLRLSVRRDSPAHVRQHIVRPAHPGRQSIQLRLRTLHAARSRIPSETSRHESVHGPAD